MAANRSAIWFGQVALALLLGALVGGLAYLVARAATTIYLFTQERAFFDAAAGVVQGGIEGLASGNLREQRLRVEAVQAQYQALSVFVGFASALCSAVGLFLRMVWARE